MNSRLIQSLKADVQEVLTMHPKLSTKLYNDIPVEICGMYEIRDDIGNLQGDYTIKVTIPLKYPYEFPFLIETSNKIERIPDRHISPEGVICEEISLLKPIIAAKGITLTYYFIHYVHKYFCWQLVYEKEGNKNLEEWAHGEAAVLEFYKSYLKINSPEILNSIIQNVAYRNLPTRNGTCPCGSKKKIKYCHEKEFNDLKSIEKNELLKHISIIEKLGHQISVY